MIIETSWDDGSSWDIRVEYLLKKYKIAGTFYIPTFRDLSDTEVKEISKDFLIGGHTQTHPLDLKKLTHNQLVDEIEGNKLYLEELIGKKINSFCYPRGRYNEEVIEVVKNAGFTEARTTIVGETESPKNRFRKNTTVHLFSGRKEYKGLKWFEYAENKLKESVEKNGYFHLWGHSYEVEKFNEWQNLENFLKIIYEYNN